MIMFGKTGAPLLVRIAVESLVEGGAILFSAARLKKYTGSSVDKYNKLLQYSTEKNSVIKVHPERYPWSEFNPTCGSLELGLPHTGVISISTKST